MKQENLNLLRYPGGKQRKLYSIIPHLHSRREIPGRFVEPFVGSAAIFFGLNPRKALLADLNSELITLYRGLRRYPVRVWEIFASLPSTKRAYYRIRNASTWPSDLASQAARTLYLNRTCFKGMWRHNLEGQFNIGYGGQDRRWVISKETLLEVSRRLKRALLRTSDFEEIIEMSKCDDFVFLDPPYRPGKRELLHAHYVYSRFTYADYERLGQALERASSRGVQWAMTISSHPEILQQYRHNTVIPLPKRSRKRRGIVNSDSGEVLILNY